MVVGRFRRTLSFPNPTRPSSSSSSTSSKPPSKSYHIRSVSLPCRSHPLIHQLTDQITDLHTTWQHSNTSSTAPNHTTTASWFHDTLTRLNTIHNSLDDILNLPQTRDSLLSYPLIINKLLEDYLRFADIYGIFQTSIVSLKEQILSAQIATRRRRTSTHSTSIMMKSTTHDFLKAQKKASKELTKLISTIQTIDHRRPATASSSSLHYVETRNDSNDQELHSIIKEVHHLTVVVSVSLFSRLLVELRLGWSGIYTSWMDGLWKRVISSSWRGETKVRVVVGECRENRTEEALLRKMEECLCGMESGSHNMFRSLISTRVSLLNILTTH